MFYKGGRYDRNMCPSKRGFSPCNKYAKKS